MLFFYVEQLRDSVRSFFLNELAPYADKIDKENSFPQMKVSLLTYCIYHLDILTIFQRY